MTDPNILTSERQEALNRLCELYGLAGFVKGHNYIMIYRDHIGGPFIAPYNDMEIPEIIGLIKRHLL